VAVGLLAVVEVAVVVLVEGMCVAVAVVEA
jgi:hypothetical protein